MLKYSEIVIKCGKNFWQLLWHYGKIFHRYIHTFIHTYIYTHIYTYWFVHVHLYRYISTCMQHIWMSACIYICMHTYMETHGSLCMHSYMHACICTYIHTCKHIDLFYMERCMHIMGHTDRNSCLPTNMKVQIQTYMDIRACLSAYKLTYLHANIQTYTCAYLDTYVYISTYP